MKKTILLLCLAFGLTPVFGQVYYEETEEEEQKVQEEPKVREIPQEEEKVSLTVGILQGGGSLVGADLEFMLDNKIGLQVGAGLVGFGAGLNYHLKPSIRSSFVSWVYWHQGFGEYHAQSVTGPTFVYRAKKWFTAQLGLGFPLTKGPVWPADMEQSPVMLLYSIGAYFPL